jgi:hypothetical protein
MKWTDKEKNARAMEGKWWLNINTDMSAFDTYAYLISFQGEQSDGKARFELVHFNPKDEGHPVYFKSVGIASLKSYEPYTKVTEIDLQRAVESIFRMANK